MTCGLFARRRQFFIQPGLGHGAERRGVRTWASFIPLARDKILAPAPRWLAAMASCRSCRNREHGYTVDASALALALLFECGQNRANSRRIFFKTPTGISKWLRKRPEKRDLLEAERKSYVAQFVHVQLRGRHKPEANDCSRAWCGCRPAACPLTPLESPGKGCPRHPRPQRHSPIPRARRAGE